MSSEPILLLAHVCLNPCSRSALILILFAYFITPNLYNFTRLWALFSSTSSISETPPIAAMSEERRNRIQWTMKMRGLGDQLTSEKITKAYTDEGDVGGLKPDQRWARDAVKATSVLDATIPDDVFYKIQDTTNVKQVSANSLISLLRQTH